MQLIVLGMHRSGTSALARVLGLMGCHVGREDELAPADEHNPKGYWEREDVWALDERILEAAGASWHDVGGFDLDRIDAPARAALTQAAREVIAGLDAHRPWAVKDPRLCLTFPLWRPLLERPVCVLVQRDPLEVARSLQRRDGFPLAAGIALWERHTRDALRHSAGLPRLLVRYERLCADPLGAVARLRDELLAAGLPADALVPPDESELRAFLDPALHREKSAPGEVLEHLNAAQRALLERVAGPQALAPDPPGPLSAGARDALDALAREKQARAADVRLLEGLIADKDGYIADLEQRYRHDVPQLEAMIAEKDRYTHALLAQLDHERRLADARPRLLSGEAAAPEAAAPDWAGTAVCTIVSRNYLSLARACCRSFLEHHPGARAFVLIADTLDGLDLGAEPFTAVAADAVGVPDFDDFAFKYNILELNTAVKPYVLEHLFEHEGVARIFYLDPDIYVFGPLLEARAALESGQIALTPHILRPIPADGRRPQEVELLMSGTYNLGFLGLRRSDETRELLHWWQERLYEGAFSDPARGMFTDQKWMDLVPGLHRGVAVLRHAGYNAAYWNLHERSDLRPAAEGGWSVGGVPLRFFHFSGFDRRDLERVSKHQDRYRLGDLPPAFRRLFEGYARALLDNGWEQTHTLPYAYGLFDNGARVPDFARRAYVALGAERRRFGNPFAAAGDHSFFAWLTRPAAPAGLSPLAAQMRALRADLRRAFPEPEGRDRLPYLDWLLEHAGPDFGLGEPYLTLLREEHAAARAPSAPGAAVPPQPVFEVAPPAPSAPLLVESGRPTRAWKRGLRALAGTHRYDRARRRVWVFYHWLARRFGVGPSARGARTAPVPVPEAPPPLPAVPRRGARVFDSKRPFGVNLFGYFDTESGVGEIARGLAAMLRAAQVPHALVNVEQNWLRRGDRRVRDFARVHPYAVDLLAVNADQAAHVARAYGLGPHDGRYRVGYWFWELARLPPAQAAAAALFDELWVASDFCLDAVAAASAVATVKVPPAIVAVQAGRRARADFGFGDEFVFLFVFDAASVVKRKNPGAAIAAFRRAFRPDDPACLVLKTVNATPRQRAAFERLAGGARVQLRDGYVPHGEVLDLVAASDAYVSLHRSEGLGLTLLDALLLGKPVVATRYSGVTEFLEGPGTYPVAWRLVPLRRNYGPYPKGAEWAEPDVADAARQMRAVYEAGRRAPREAAAGGGEGLAGTLRRRYSAEQTSRRLVERLEVIRGVIAP